MIFKDASESMEMIYAVSNLALDIFFSLNEMSRAVDVVDQVMQNVPAELKCPKSHKVAFNYYSGRIFLFDNRFQDAEVALSSAMNECLATSIHNKRSISLII